MGNESGGQDRGFYALADYVIRHCWSEHVFASRGPRSLGVVWLPNGYRTGLRPMRREIMLSAAEWQVPGVFVGVLTGRMLAEKRAAMTQAVAATKLPFVVMGTSGFGQGLGTRRLLQLGRYYAASRWAAPKLIWNYVPSGGQ